MVNMLTMTSSYLGESFPALTLKIWFLSAQLHLQVHINPWVNNNSLPRVYKIVFFQKTLKEVHIEIKFEKLDQGSVHLYYLLNNM